MEERRPLRVSLSQRIYVASPSKKKSLYFQEEAPFILSFSNIGEQEDSVLYGTYIFLCMYRYSICLCKKKMYYDGGLYSVRRPLWILCRWVVPTPTLFCFGLYHQYRRDFDISIASQAWESLRKTYINKPTSSNKMWSMQVLYSTVRSYQTLKNSTKSTKWKVKLQNNIAN